MQGGPGTEPEPSEPFFPKPKAEPEPPEPFSRNRNRNHPFLLNSTEHTAKPFLQRNRQNRKPEPLEPFHPQTVTEPNRTGASLKMVKCNPGRLHCGCPAKDTLWARWPLATMSEKVGAFSKEPSEKVCLLGNENSAQSFSDRSFWKSLRVVDVRASGSWISALTCIFFQDFDRPDRSFGPGYPREWPPDIRGMSVPKLPLWADFSFLTCHPALNSLHQMQAFFGEGQKGTPNRGRPNFPCKPWHLAN